MTLGTDQALEDVVAARSEARAATARRYATARWVSGGMAVAALAALVLTPAAAGQAVSYLLLRASLVPVIAISAFAFATIRVRERRETAWAEFATSDAGSTRLAGAFSRARSESREGSLDFTESDFVDYVRRDNQWLRQEPIKPGPFSTWLIIGRTLFRVRELPVAAAAPVARLVLARLMERKAVVPFDRPDGTRAYRFTDTGARAP